MQDVKQIFVGAFALVACGVGLSSGADAAQIGLTEGNNRTTVPGTTPITGAPNNDAPNSGTGFNLTDQFSDNHFDGNDSLKLFGRIVRLKDIYEFESNVPFTISLIDDLDPNGFRQQSGGSNTARFNLTRQNSFSLGTPQNAPQQLFTVGAGDYTFSIDGNGDAALYDIGFESADVPVPATLGLLGMGLFGVGLIARRFGHR